jgi:hypothetical protein
MGNYASKGDSYTISESNDTFQPKGNYAIRGESHTKVEAANLFQPKGNYALVGASYTKGETDTKFADAGLVAKDTFQPKGNYAIKGDSYTKGESDTKFADAGLVAKDTFQPKGNYALVGASYTKGETDTRFADAGLLAKDTFQPKGNYALVGASYTKEESNIALNTAVKASDDKLNVAANTVNARIQTLVNNNTLADMKPNTMWCADGELCKFPQGKKGIDWGYGASKIYDDAQLKIESDDNIFMRVANDNVANFTKDNIFVYGSKALQFGGGIDREVNAGQISYGRHDGGENGSLNIVGGGKNGQKRRVRVWDTLQLNGWTINADDGHLRFFHNGDQKFVVHNDGRAWSAGDGGWFNNFVRDDKEYAIISTRPSNDHSWVYLTRHDEWNGHRGKNATYHAGKGEWQRFRFEKY